MEIPASNGGRKIGAGAGAWLVALVALLSFGGAGCSQSGGSKDLAVLDRAYRLGVLNKDEYDAKRAALESQSAAVEALDKALAAGALTQADYKATKSRLIAKAGALTALEKARQTGVLSQEEYLAKRAALMGDDTGAVPLAQAQAGSAPAAPADPAPPAPAGLAPPAPARPAPLGLTPPSTSDASASDTSASGTPTGAPADNHQPPPPAQTPSPAPARSQESAAVPTSTATSSSVPSQVLRMTAIDQAGFDRPIPPGGKIVYGQVQGKTTEASAMAAVLHSLHNQVGGRPQVGKLFQVRGTQSVAAFFSASRRNQGDGQIAGLIIVTKATSDHVEAALVADDAARFPKTLGSMMKTLFAVWHPLEAARAPGAESSGPAPLRQITLPDRSASVSLPDGWNIVPKLSMMGSIVARGPKDESAELGITFLVEDTNNPRVQQTLQTLRNGGLRNTAYATATYYPYGGDMSKTFVYLMQNLRQKAGLPQASYNFTSVTPAPGPSARCVRMVGTVDLGDGKGGRELNVVYCTTPPTPAAGVWMSAAYMTSAPVQVAAAERATLAAILQSFNVNMSVIRAQGAQLAAPAIAQIHAVGKAAANQAAAAHERNDIQNSSVYQRWDNLDKRSQEFENYQLGFTVISNTEHTGHATLWNEQADELVQKNPDRFEYVSAPDYWKGIDY